MSGYLPTLAVHVVWHPACAAAGDHAQALFADLFEDPEDLAAHGLRIPVRLWRSFVDATGHTPAPSVPPLEESERCAVVVLIDDEFIDATGWLAFLDALHAAKREQDVLLPVALSAAVADVQSSLLQEQLISLHDRSDALRESVLVNRVSHALCRMLGDSSEPVTVFLSHAKSDGVPITDIVRNHLQNGSGLANFFDAQDILEGTRWASSIHGAAAANVLLAIRTDAYATRDWCRTEVLDAKRGGSPVIVLDALDRLEPRGFPYLGNTPSVRWHDGSPKALEQLVGVVLHETLRFRHFPARVADLCRAYGLAPHELVLATPPELLTALGARDAHSATALVYPDPPLGSDELALVHAVAPDLAMTTPTGLIAHG